MDEKRSSDPGLGAQGVGMGPANHPLYRCGIQALLNVVPSHYTSMDLLMVQRDLADGGKISKTWPLPLTLGS